MSKTDRIPLNMTHAEPYIFSTTGILKKFVRFSVTEELGCAIKSPSTQPTGYGRKKRFRKGPNDNHDDFDVIR